MGGQRGLSRAWHERYCVLQYGILEYYVSHEDHEGGADEHRSSAAASSAASAAAAAASSAAAGGGGGGGAAPLSLNAGKATPKSKVPFPLFGASVISPAKRNGLALGKHAPLSFEIKPPKGAPSAVKSLVFSAPSARLLQQWLVAINAAAKTAAPTRLSVSSTAYLEPQSVKTDGGSGGSGARQASTRLEEADAAIAEEAAWLDEELSRLRQAGSADTAEFAAMLQLIEGLRPVLPPGYTSLACDDAAPPLMRNPSSLVSSEI